MQSDVLPAGGTRSTHIADSPLVLVANVPQDTPGSVITNALYPVTRARVFTILRIRLEFSTIAAPNTRALLPEGVSVRVVVTRNLAPTTLGHTFGPFPVPTLSPLIDTETGSEAFADADLLSVQVILTNTNDAPLPPGLIVAVIATLE